MHHVVERIARDSYAKLLAFIAARNGHDIAAAEDALADAFASALACWTKDAVPDKPEAWLLKTARNRLIDQARRHHVAERSQLFVARSASVEDSFELEIIPDERLQMMFACAHPAIDAKVRTPLLLQVALGMSAESIAAAFLVPPATMSQRLVRAKTKIRDAGIAFEIPATQHLGNRLQTVLDAIYAAYGTAWVGLDQTERELASEAIDLARVVVQLLPNQPEAQGLLSLLLFCHARRFSRRSSQGIFVPLDEQDTEQWRDGEIEEAEELLREASQHAQPGRYQLEAAIQSAHMQRRHGSPAPWSAIVDMYRLLSQLAPSVGATVGQAAAMAQAGMLEQALAELGKLSSDSVKSYQPYWAVRAHILRQLKRPEATQAYDRAIGLSIDGATRNFLISERASAVAH